MDEVIKLDVPWLPDPHESDPRLFADAFTMMVIYEVAETAPTDDVYAVLRFQTCRIVKFGYPNDEALPGHPLYPKGLRCYGLFEVRDSSWSKSLDEYNPVSFPNLNQSRDSYRHFIVTFHDSTPECIAQAWKGAFRVVGIRP
jgi:hypothetical protein